MSDMMSDMKTIAKPAKKKARARRKPAARREFTVRDLNRNTAELLEAARKHGSVTVRSRAGESFRIEAIKKLLAVPEPSTFEERHRRFRELMASLGNKCGPNVDVERLNKIIAGEI